MRESVAKFYRSRTLWIVVLAVVLLACLVGVLVHCYIAPLSVEAHDVLSAAVILYNGSERRVIHVDATDPDAREEVARLLNGLHRWHGEATEGMPRAELEVRLRDGTYYYVTWWLNNDLELVIDKGEPDRETPMMWVRSEDVKEFLTEYLEQ